MSAPVEAPARCVVVVAHPLPESFVAAAADAVQRGVIAGSGVAAAVIDLYAERYRPGADLDPVQRRMLEAASTLVLVHPTWWTAQPAILHGWLQRLAEERLPSVRTVVQVATHGGPRWTNVVAGRAGRRTVRHVAGVVSGGRARVRWVPCYGLDRSSPRRRARQLRRVESTLQRLARTTPRRAARHGGRRWSSSS